MGTKMNQLLNRLFLVDNYPQLIIQIVEDEIINDEEAVRLIFAQARQPSTETKLDLLAQLLAQICVKKQALQCVQDQMNSVINEASNSPQKIFLKKCLREIAHLAEKIDVSDLNMAFTLHYFRLSAVAFDF